MEVLGGDFVDVELTAEQKELTEATRDYANRVIRPASQRLEALEDAEDFPWDLMREGTALGLKALLKAFDLPFAP